MCWPCSMSDLDPSLHIKEMGGIGEGKDGGIGEGKDIRLLLHSGDHRSPHTPPPLIELPLSWIGIAENVEEKKE